MPTQQEKHPWEQRSDENTRWYSRFTQFLALGAARSVREVYRQEKGNEESTTAPRSWKEAFRRFDWLARAAAYDAWQNRAVFSDPAAIDPERLEQLESARNDVLSTIKLMQSRLTVEMETMPVNDRFLAEYRGLVNLFFKITNGYAPQRIEHTGKDGSPIEVHEEQAPHVVFYMPEVRTIEHDRSKPPLPNTTQETPTETA